MPYQAQEWRVLVAETRTGRVVADVRQSSQPTFSRAIGDAGSWGVDVHLDDPGNRAVDFHTYATSARYSWVICYGTYAVQAGPVSTYGLAEDGRTLSVGGTGIGALFKQRVLRNPTGSVAIVDASEDIHYDGEFLWEVLRRLVAYGIAEGSGITPGSPAYLPINLGPGWPNQGAGNASKGSYYGYDLAMIWDRMTQLSDRLGGPEFEFAPVVSGDGTALSWDLRIGTPLLGNQTTAAVWDLGGALQSVSIDGDASTATITRTWVKGEGSDRGLRTGFEENTSLYALGHPRKDYVDAEHTSVVVQETLESYADQVLASFRLPYESWGAEIRIDGLSSTYGTATLSPPLGQWDPGDAPTFGIQGHSWIPNGNYRRRVLGFDSAGENTVRLTLQEEEQVP